MIKGRIFAVKRCEIHDGDGLRTTVFLKGCPLRCKWCHNPESLSMVKQIACYTDKCLSCARCVSVCKSGVHSFTGGVKTTDYSSCVSCGECVKFCRAGALHLEEGHAVVDRDKCVLCGYCARVCPQFSVKVI